MYVPTFPFRGVKFIREMMDNSWSWVRMSPETFRHIIGQPHYLQDRKTCVLKVRLEPGRTYVIWFNSEKFRNFRDTDGLSAIPYLLVFETRK